LTNKPQTLKDFQTQLSNRNVCRDIHRSRQCESISAGRVLQLFKSMMRENEIAGQNERLTLRGDALASPLSKKILQLPPETLRGLKSLGLFNYR